MIVQTADLPNVIVLLTAETRVGQIQGVLKAQRKDMVGLLDSATDPHCLFHRARSCPPKHLVSARSWTQCCRYRCRPGGSRYRTLTVFNNVTSFHESAGETLYSDRHEGARLDRSRGWRDGGTRLQGTKDRTPRTGEILSSGHPRPQFHGRASNPAEERRSWKHTLRT
jgi:hypothetical protein